MQFNPFDYIDKQQGTLRIGYTTFAVMTVTKEIAKCALANKFKGQRNQQPNWVEYLFREMSSSRFVVDNGQTIVFDDDGHLLDGQHRLEAIVSSGIPQTFLVAIIKAERAERAFYTLDNNSKRKTSLYLNGPSKNARTTIAAIDYCMKKGEAPLLSSIQSKVTARAQVSRTEVIQHNNTNEEYITQVVREATRMRTAIGKGSMVSLGGFICLVRFVHKDELISEFIDDFSSQAPSSRTIQACLNIIRKQYMSGRNPTQKWLLGTLLDTYEHYVAMDDSVMLNKQNKRLSDYNNMMQCERAIRSKK